MRFLVYLFRGFRKRSSVGFHKTYGATLRDRTGRRKRFEQRTRALWKRERFPAMACAGERPIRIPLAKQAPTSPTHSSTCEVAALAGWRRTVARSGVDHNTLY